MLMSTDHKINTQYPALLSMQNYPYSEFNFCLQTHFCSRIFGSRGSEWKILQADKAHFKIQSFINTQSCRIWAMGKSFLTCNTSASFCMVWIDCIFYCLSRKRVMRTPLLLSSIVSFIRIFLSNRPFQHFNRVHVWIELFSCKIMFFRTL